MKAHKHFNSLNRPITLVLLYKSIADQSDFLAVHEDIAEVEKWSTASHLTLNPLKCIYLIISRKSKPLQPKVALVLNDHTLGQVDICKLTGFEERGHFVHFPNFGIKTLEP